MTQAAVWRCLQPLDRVLLAWEGEQHAVFYDPLTGDTHLIAALGLQLAEWLQDGPLPRQALRDRLAQDVDWDAPPSPEQLDDMLDLHLQRLSDIHLLAAEPSA